MRIRLWAVVSILISIHNNSFADDIRYLAHGREALASFTQLAKRAKKSIDLSTFIFEPCDASTRVLLKILAAQAQRGVKVRLLLDAPMQDKKKIENLAHYLSQYGIELRMYNDFLVLNLGVNLRMHSKLLIVDGESFIAGGRNISDQYFGISDLQNWVDRDAWVTGSSAAQAARDYDEFWDSELTSTKAGNAAKFVSWPQFCGDKYSGRENEVESFLTANARAIVESIPMHSCANVQVVNDHADFGNPKYGDTSDSGQYMNPVRLNRKRTTKKIVEFTAGARSSLHMENWAYIPVERLDETTAGLRNRGVKLETVINADMDLDMPDLLRQAMQYSNHKYGTRDTKGSQRVMQLSRRQAISDAWELTPVNAPYIIHSKVFVRDGRDAIVGSFNWDPRSYATNLETAVVVQNCPAFVADVNQHFMELRKIYEDDLAAGYEINIEPTSFFAKMFAELSIWIL